MASTPSMHERILLCASSSHCAQVLRAAASAGVDIHGLQPMTHWPACAPETAPLLMWALLPAGEEDAAAQALEQDWRARLLQQGTPWTVQMLYGTAQQQALQLAPWVYAGASGDGEALWCSECLDARSEQSLFRHLLLRSG